MSTNEPRLHRIPAVQERLGVGRSKVFDLFDSGELRSVKVGKCRLVSESAIRDFIARLEATQAPSLDALPRTDDRPGVA